MSDTKANDLLALNAAQAVITTAAVTIRTLRVGPKQLTQAVFRQLCRAELMAWNGPKLLGTIWGWVNYCPPGEDQIDRQFIVQFGDELYRCPFKVRFLSVGREFDRNRWHPRIDEWFDNMEWLAKAWLLSSFLEQPWEPSMVEMREYYHTVKNSVWSKTVPGNLGTRSLNDLGVENLKIYLNPDGQHYFDLKAHCMKPKDKDVARNEAKSKLIDELNKTSRTYRFYDEGNVEHFAHLLEDTRRQIDEYIPRWNELMGRLSDAPQLFIAV